MKLTYKNKMNVIKLLNKIFVDNHEQHQILSTSYSQEKFI